MENEKQTSEIGFFLRSCVCLWRAGHDNVVMICLALKMKILIIGYMVLYIFMSTFFYPLSFEYDLSLQSVFK